MGPRRWLGQRTNVQSPHDPGERLGFAGRFLEVGLFTLRFMLAATASGNPGSRGSAATATIRWAAAVLLLAWTLATHAADAGPQVVGCDFRLNQREGTGTCLIVGSGTNQGVSWTVFEVEGRRYRYQDDQPKVIALVDRKGRELKRLKGENASAPCRPGGREADVYSFAGGDRVCLYW